MMKNSALFYCYINYTFYYGCKKVFNEKTIIFRVYYFLCEYFRTFDCMIDIKETPLNI